MSEGEKLLSSNPTARQNYFIQETLEAGIVLTGTEIKSMRASAPNLRDAFVEVNSHSGKLEAWLLNANVGHYSHGNIWNHDPVRRRKLLLKRVEIERLYSSITRDGMTIVPTRLYLKNGRAKIEIAVGKGKKKHDKRDTLKKKSAEREMDQARKKNR